MKRKKHKTILLGNSKIVSLLFSKTLSIRLITECCLDNLRQKCNVFHDEVIITDHSNILQPSHGSEHADSPCVMIE